MVVHEIIYYQAEHFFAVLHEQVKAATEDAFAMGLLQNNESICSELDAAVSKAVDETIGFKQADAVIRRGTYRSFDLESLVERTAQRIVEDANIVK